MQLCSSLEVIYVLFLNSLKKNNTYNLVRLLKGRKALRNKGVLKLKKDGNQIIKYKAQVVVKGCTQKKGVDFSEIFCPIVKMCSIQFVLRLAASLDLELEQLDVKIVFLRGDLQEESTCINLRVLKLRGRNI